VAPAGGVADTAANKRSGRAEVPPGAGEERRALDRVVGVDQLTSEDDGVERAGEVKVLDAAGGPASRRTSRRRVTRCPRAANGSAMRPVPHPSSSTRAAGGIAAWMTPASPPGGSAA
jgi:hypothetical protein